MSGVSDNEFYTSFDRWQWGSYRILQFILQTCEQLLMLVASSQDPLGKPRFPFGSQEVAAADGLETMPPAGAIRMLGLQLDRGFSLEVSDGGLVAPSGATVPQYLGAETENVGTRSFPSTPAASASSSGAASSPPSSETTPPSATASLERSGIRARYEDELGSVQTAYPGTRIWHDEDGMWLLSESSVVHGLDRAATFLVALCWSKAAVRAWGFWRENAISVRWIGPRHTNFPDGSICAFDPVDKTWAFGDPIVALLDLYTVWALRHLHLEWFDRWPGQQAVFHPYERRVEFRPDESCGCGSEQSYRDCCAPRDAARKFVPDFVSFALRFSGGLRVPPPRMAEIALNATQPPSIGSIGWQ